VSDWAPIEAVAQRSCAELRGAWSWLGARGRLRVGWLGSRRPTADRAVGAPSGAVNASGWRGGSGGPPELEQVVGGGDQPPLGSAGGQSSSLEAVGAAVVFGLAEDRLDRLHALAVQRASKLGPQHGAHEVITAATEVGVGVLAAGVA